MPSTLLHNLHSHTHYCDGTHPPEAYLIAALEAGLAAYGFSSHAPLPFEKGWAMRAGRLGEYVQEVRRLQQEWQGRMEVLCGLEVDFIPGRVGPSSFADAGLDYTIGSIHFVDAWPDGEPFEADGPTSIFDKGIHEIFGGDVRSCVERYFALTAEMVLHDPPTLVGHLDKIKIHNTGGRWWDESARWYRDAVVQCLEAVAKAGLPVEVNTRGVYLGKTPECYPGTWVMQQMRRLGIRAVINTDAHHPSQVAAGHEAAIAALRTAGHVEHWLLGSKGWSVAKL